jgi:hypothetical protein
MVRNIMNTNDGSFFTLKTAGIKNDPRQTEFQTQDSNEIPSATPMFSGSSYPGLVETLPAYHQTGRNRVACIKTNSASLAS